MNASMEFINKIGLKPVKTLLDLLFKDGYVISNHKYEEGQYHDFDGLGGYLKKPTLAMIVKANDKKYRLDFYKDYRMDGPYWYWNPKKPGIAGTCFFENYDRDRIVKYYEENYKNDDLKRFEINL